MADQTDRLNTNQMKFLKGFIVLFLFGVIFYFIPLQKTADVLFKARLEYVFLAILLRIVLLLISSYKLYLLLHDKVLSLSGPSGYVTVSSIYFIGRFFSNFLPTSFGGDLFKVRELALEGMDAEDAVSGVFMDRLTGISGVLLLGVFIALPGFGWLEPYGLAFVRYPFLVTSTVVLGVLYFWGIRSIVLVHEFMEQREILPGVEFLSQLIESLNKYSDRPKEAWGCLVFSVVYHLVRAVYLWIGILAVGEVLRFPLVLPAVPIITLISLIPITVNNLGVREGIITFVFTTVGLGAPESLAVALLTRVIGYTISLVGGLAYFFRPSSV